MIRIYERKKRGITEEDSIRQMIQDEINRIKWILEYTEDGVEYRFGEKIYKAKYPGEIMLAPGEKIHLAFDINKIHLFDKRTEKAII